MPSESTEPQTVSSEIVHLTDSQQKVVLSLANLMNVARSEIARQQGIIVGVQVAIAAFLGIPGDGGQYVLSDDCKSVVKKGGS